MDFSLRFVDIGKFGCAKMPATVTVAELTLASFGDETQILYFIFEF
jgi:hypothetical protein